MGYAVAGAGGVLFFIGQLAHDFRFRHHYAIHGGDASHFGHAGLAFDHLHFHAQGVAGHHRLAEAGVFHGHQQHQFIRAIGYRL